VPADSDRKLAKSTGAGADALILDLEDSVLPERKLAARGLAREFLGSAVPGVQIWVRVNDLASGELLKDLTAIDVYKRQVMRRDELGILAEGLQLMQTAVQSRDRSIRQLAYEDTLTGLMNRTAFGAALNLSLIHISPLITPASRCSRCRRRRTPTIRIDWRAYAAGSHR